MNRYHANPYCGMPHIPCRQAEPRCSRYEAAPREDRMGDAALAMAYVPWQHWNTTYECDVALCRGTIFPQLDLPFMCYGRCGK